jgi:predicted nucleic acid-binding protein
MFVVVDVNVVLSSLLSKGDSFDVFAINSVFNKFEFVAPEFMLVELDKHKEEIFERSGLSRDIFDKDLEFVLGQINFIPKTEFSKSLSQARKISSKHLKDVQYVTLALELKCPIFFRR